MPSTLRGARCKEALPLQHRVFSYVERGFYSEQLRRLWRYFPKEQTLILKLDDFKDSPARILAEIACFLDISDFKGVQYKDVHSRPYVTDMTKTERLYLQDIFFHEIKQLEVMLGWSCENWLT